MKIVIFGLTISSSWGNGHATLWRGLCRHLIALGHTVSFFERDVSYYSETRDLFDLPGGRLALYPDWETVRADARAEVRDADVAIVTSYCPDAAAATELILEEPRALAVFYDMDTPITLERLSAGQPVPYIGERGLEDFDLVLSFTGGQRLIEEYRSRFGAGPVYPLYGHVDPDVYHPASPQPHYRADLSYLGTYSDDRQLALEALLVAPARARADRRFLIAGAQYPEDFPWSPNIYFVRHLPPSEHPAFYASSRLTLNVTRRAMAEMGWCPSGRLFEASACGVPILSDAWPGIDAFFEPGKEILLARDEADSLAALALEDSELARIGRRARERTLDQHSSRQRTIELIALLERCGTRSIRQPSAEEA